MASQQQQKQQALSAQQADFQKTITWAQYQVPRISGIPQVSSGYNRIILKETYETLVRYQGSSVDFSPSLAERWEGSPDGLSYTFYLRHNVKFYPSGDTFNAQVVKWNFDNAFNGNSFTPVYLFGGPTWVQYDHTQVVDDYTVKVFIKRPLAWFMRMIAYVQTGGIANPNFVNAHGGFPKTIQDLDPYLLSHQDVTGPYIVQDFVPSDKIILKRNPTYWMGWTGDMAKHPEQVVIRTVPETSTRMLLIARGDADLTFVEIPYLNELKSRIASEKLPLILDESPNLQIRFVIIDMKHAPTNDVHIRKMMSYSFNYDQFINNIMHGFADRLISFPPIGAPGYQPDVSYYKFDLDKAKQELALADPANQTLVKNGLNVVYTPGYSAIDKEALLMWKGDLAKIGVNLVLNEVPYSVARDVQVGGGWPKYSAFAYGWNPDFLDPATWYAFMYNSYAVATSWGTTPDWVMNLFEKAAFEPSWTNRLQIYRQAEQYIYDQAVFVRAVSLKGGGNYNVRGNWVKNYTSHVLDDHKPEFLELWKQLPQSGMNPAAIFIAFNLTPKKLLNLDPRLA